MALGLELQLFSAKYAEYFMKETVFNQNLNCMKSYNTVPTHKLL